MPRVGTCGAETQEWAPRRERGTQRKGLQGGTEPELRFVLPARPVPPNTAFPGSLLENKALILLFNTIVEDNSCKQTSSLKGAVGEC